MSGTISLLGLLSVLLLDTTFAFGKHTLSADESKALDEWLASHSDYRVATGVDCSCTESITRIRTGWGGIRPVPDYHPYRVAGDFNKDGSEDIAVVVVKRASRIHGFALLVFNGSQGAGLSLAFSKIGLDLQGQGLFFGPPAGEGSLLLGFFYSDAAVIVQPKDGTYALLAPRF
jgi:hypothetical protein